MSKPKKGASIKQKKEPEEVAFETLVEAINRGEENIVLKRKHATDLARHIQFLDKRYAGTLDNQRLLDRLFDQQFGAADALAGLLQRTVGQVEVLSVAAKEAGILKDDGEARGLVARIDAITEALVAAGLMEAPEKSAETEKADAAEEGEQEAA